MMGKVPAERRTKIINYLNEAGCKPTLKGYNLFISLISLSADEPDLGCYELFDAYAFDLYGERLGSGGSKKARKVWWSLYRDCQYALKASLSTKTVYDFIRSCAINLEETV